MVFLLRAGYAQQKDMKRKKLIILPKLSDAGGDIRKDWFIYYSYRNPKTGKMQRFRIYEGFKSINNINARRRYADKKIRELTEKLKHGWTPFDDDQVIYDDMISYANIANVYGKRRKGNKTLKYYTSQFIEHIRDTVSYRSLDTYRSKLRHFVLWAESRDIAENDLSVYDEGIIDSFFTFIIKNRKLQGRTVKKYGQILRRFFDYLISEGVTYSNPVVKIPKAANTIDHGAKPIRTDDVEKLKQLISKEDKQLWLAILFQFYCFIRPGIELRFMRIQWIDFTTGTITIPAAMEVNGKMEKISKNGKESTIVVPSQFLRVLKNDYKLDKYDKRMFVFDRGGEPGYFPLGHNTLRNRFNRFRDELGLSKDYKFYSWKHTGCVFASNAGIPVKDIQMQMRHYSLDITDKYLRKMKGIDSEHLKNGFPDI